MKDIVFFLKMIRALSAHTNVNISMSGFNLILKLLNRSRCERLEFQHQPYIRHVVFPWIHLG